MITNTKAGAFSSDGISHLSAVLMNGAMFGIQVSLDDSGNPDFKKLAVFTAKPGEQGEVVSFDLTGQSSRS